MMGKRLAHQRLAAFLLSLSGRYARLKRDPLMLELNMFRNDIASFLGIAVETVSRLFTLFQENGLLEVRGKQVRILSLTGLQAVCDGTGPEAAMIAASGERRVRR